MISLVEHFLFFFFFFFFFCWWCCHGVTTQVFYSGNIKYRYHMQSWIWIWYICLNYGLQKIICLKPTTPEGCDWLISVPKCNKNRDQGKILAEREAKLEQGPASTTRKEPSQNSQKWWASTWYEKAQSWRHWAANTSYTEADNNLEHDNIPRHSMLVEHPLNPTATKENPLPSSLQKIFLFPPSSTTFNLW